MIGLDEIFGDRVGASRDEPLTPYKTAICLLIVAMDARREHMRTRERARCALLLHELIESDEITFAEMKARVERQLVGGEQAARGGIYEEFLQAIEDSRGDVEVAIGREHVGRNKDRYPFVLPKSVVGVFVRKMALARARESLTELLRSHRDWLRWLDASGDAIHACRDAIGEKGEMAIGNVRFMDESNEAEPDLLAPRLGAVQIEKFSPTKERVLASILPTRFSIAALQHPTAFCGRFNSPHTTASLVGGVHRGLSSRRARKLLDKQMHLLHVAPSEAMLAQELDAMCDAILQLYPAQALVYLVKMMNAIRCRDMRHAEDALRLYFDWTAIHNDDLVAPAIARESAADDEEMANPLNKVIDRRQLRYAPILQARLSRIFGFREIAMRYLADGIQQAQDNFDFVCLRLALVESRAIDFMQAKEEDGESDKANAKEKPLFSVRMLHMLGEERNAHDYGIAAGDVDPTVIGDDGGDGAEQDAVRGVGEEEEDDEFLESNAVRRSRPENSNAGKAAPQSSSLDGGLVRQVRQLDALQRMMVIASTGGANVDIESTISKLQRSVISVCPPGGDLRRERQRRVIEDTAIAIGSSLRLSRGHSHEAKATADCVLHVNAGDLWCRRYDTEAHAVAAVNVAYSLAFDGQYEQALHVVRETKRRFPASDCWQNARHWRLCEAIVKFESAFFAGRMKPAFAELAAIRNCNAEEADLRESMFYAVRGELTKALDIAGNRMILARKIGNIRAICRAQLVLATLYANVDRCEFARGILEECREKAMKLQLTNIANSATRRLARVQLQSSELDDALNALDDGVLASIEALNGPLEFGLALLVRAEALKQLRERKGQRFA